MIVEVEPNPAGKDAGNEWVRLFNPLFKPVDLSGWRISSTHGRTHTYTVAESIGACDDLKIIFSRQFIDNEDESLILHDETGTEIDSTPAITDNANDASTWKMTTPACDFL